MMKKKYLAFTALAIPASLLLAGCSVGDLSGETYDKAESKSAATSEDGVKSGLLADWVPAGGRDVKLEQRTTGAERIFVMDYDGPLPRQECLSLSIVGEPNESELAKAYAADRRTRDLQVSEVATVRTLDADWWPNDAEKQTTDLCGRWWVHESQGKLYGFAPDQQQIAESVLRERSRNDRDS